MLDPETCKHDTGRVKPDEFVRNRLGRRSTPGDVVCGECMTPLPAWWNNGKPKWIEESEKQEAK